MSDNDDVLTLPVEGDGGSGERDAAGARRGGAGMPAGGGALPHVGGLAGTELVSLSSEARLATALLLQAQALEGMRHAQSDLLRRLEDGSGGAARRAVEELQDNLREIQQSQQQTLSQLARARRRASHRVGLAVAALVLAVAGGLWCVHLWNRDLAGAVEQTRVQFTGAVDALGADRAALEASLAGVLQASGAEQARSVQELADALRATEVALRGQLERTQHERDAALAAVAASGAAAAELGDELAVAQESQQQLSEELGRTRDERNQHIGEAVRLRGQVLDAERRLTELTQSIGALTEAQAVRAQAPDPGIVTVHGDPESLPARVSRALAASGAPLAQVFEVDAVRDGALTGLLVLLAGESPVAPRVLAAERGSLLAVDGRAVLRLFEVRERDRTDVVPSLDVELPDLDPEAWHALGVTPPAGFTPVPRVAIALGSLLAPHGYTVVALRSFDGVTLGEVELRQEDSQGAVLRTLKAARGEVLPVGPELVLQSGSITIAGDERPFFQGECRLALPGSDFGQWLAAIASPHP